MGEQNSEISSRCVSATIAVVAPSRESVADSRSCDRSLAVTPAFMGKNEILDPQRPAPAGEYSSKIQPSFDRSCGTSDCHGGGLRGFAGGLDLTSYDGLMRGSKYGAVVISGVPFMSHLVQSVNSSDTLLSPVSSVQMPAGRNPLPNEDIQTIVQWIRNGARSDAGSIPFPEPRPLEKIYFTSQFVDLVGVIDRASNLVMRYQTVGRPLPISGVLEAPHNVQVDDQGRYIYVILISGNKLRKYDAVTLQLLGEVAVGTFPAHVVVTADGSKAYVTNFDQSVGRVFVVNTASMTVTKVITSTFMKATHAARLSHSGDYLFVASNGLDHVHVIRTANDSIVASIPVAAGVPPEPVGSFVHKPYQIAVRNDDQFIYVTLNGTGRVSVIKKEGDSFRLLSDTIRVGTRPLQCEVTRDQRFLYVCNQGSGSVSVIDAQTHTFLRNIPDVGPQPHGIDISEDSRTVFVTCENVSATEPPHHPVLGSTAPGFLTLIDVQSQTVIRRIEVGGFAAGVSVYPGKGN